MRSVCFGMDVVLHLAGINARDYAIDPIRALEFNGVGTGKLLTADNVFNVGGNWTSTVWEIACFIRKISLKILGFESKISRIEPLSSEKIKGLEYSIDKLIETGFVLKNDREEEIIRLIKFCETLKK